ncbi:amidase [Pseudonocardia ailaonensis]|uniref:Amidase n=1 Tax=Pseudonocardia ailaonensis TaxID=367279 RepID=A0ABN2N473_9PSEU
MLDRHRAAAEAHPGLNSLVAEDWEGAARTAEAIDARRARGEPLGPLAGVPLTVKDVVAVAGLRLTAGSRAFAGNIATSTAPAVARLLAADAVLVGKTNCPEFAFGGTCANDLFGTTGNPRFPDRSPGGSSGGEAAALAAGISSLGLGTDFGGSVRWPAQCTGIVALRPSVGRVPAAGQVPGLGGSVAAEGTAWPSPTSMQGRFQVVGPLARTVADLVLALDVLAPGRPAGDGPLRVGWSDGALLGPVRAEVAAAVRAAAERLAGGPRAMPAAFADCLGPYNALRDIDPMHDHLLAVAGREDLVSPDCLRTFAASLGADAATHTAAWRRALEAQAAALAVFDEVDVVLLPVAGGPACLPDGTVDVDGTPVGGWALMAHCRAVTLLGAPAVSVPVATSAEGLPISVQVVAAPGRDEVALRAAALLERA